jgi:hypothetical protein
MGASYWQWKRIIQRYEAVLAKLPAIEKWAFELGWREAGHCANAGGLAAPRRHLGAKINNLNNETAETAATACEIPRKKNGIGTSTPHRAINALDAGTRTQGDRKMRDRNTEATAGAASSPEAPKKKRGPGTRTPRATKAKGRPGKKPASSKKTDPGPAPKARKSVREASKKEKILRLLRRAGGVTLKELTRATSWQAHSVRGFLSAQVGKKMGLKVVSAKAGNGERRYSLCGAPHNAERF